MEIKIRKSEPWPAPESLNNIAVHPFSFIAHAIVSQVKICYAVAKNGLPDFDRSRFGKRETKLDDFRNISVVWENEGTQSAPYWLRK